MENTEYITAILLMSPYDHVKPFQHLYQQQPTETPCQPQASFFQLLKFTKNLLFFLCAVIAFNRI